MGSGARGMVKAQLVIFAGNSRHGLPNGSPTALSVEYLKMLPTVSGELGWEIRCPNLKKRSVRLPRSQATSRLEVVGAKCEKRCLKAAIDDEVLRALRLVGKQSERHFMKSYGILVSSRC